ncbi:MAG: 30S ribosomal protein S8e [Candidatus Nitrosothermus koennekii]|nr:MAG: 30S ribosomal protein S8e [Candidatus Nitrosothermus koennekii]
MKRSVENLTKRKLTGGKRRAYRSRRKYEIDRYPSEPIVGEAQIVKKRVRGGNIKLAVREINYANVATDNKVTRAKIVRVTDNPANRDYARRGVITKGAIIETEVGNAKVISRPGQDGTVNAILLK